MTKIIQFVTRRVGIGAIAGLLVVGGGSAARADDVSAAISLQGNIAFQAPDSTLWITGVNRFHAKALPLSMMPGTHASICEVQQSLPTRIEGLIAVHGSDGTLQRIHPRTLAVTNTGLALAPGASPSISQDCGYTAFRGATGTLWVGSRDLGYDMMPGTNVAVSPAGRMVFHGSNGNLWFSRRDGGGSDMGFPMMAGTTPAISGDGVIAFQHGNGNLWIIRVGGRVRDTGLPMAAGTSPVISVDGGFDFARIAFQGANGNVWTTVSSLDGRGNDSGRAMMPGTSPAISTDASGIAWHAANDHLQTDSDGHFRDEGFLLSPGTDPA